MPARRFTNHLLRLILLGLLAPIAAQAQQNVAFVTVALDPETRKADDALSRYLRERTELQFDPMPMEYEEAIRRVASWNASGQPYLARLTPYAYVAAEMLGADFEILGTYNSRATGVTTYHSYFVVNRKAFKSQPSLSDLLEFVRKQRATFIYHDKFSASSYFLPSLFFRRQRVFATDEATESSEGIAPLRVVKDRGGSSSALVEQVAAGHADIAAVWDGTKKKFEANDIGQQVYFIQLPDPIPNDLLVCARWMPKRYAEEVRTAIHSMKRDGDGEINTGDYRWWEEFKDADEARRALAALRRIAVEQPAPVTVVVRNDSAGETDSLRVDPYVEAARQAVRLSGSEFVLFDPDVYVHKDAIWTVRRIHDGAVELKVDIQGSELESQRFQISFNDFADLTKRIGGLLHSRMHRIRYVWPYDAKTPTVVRDVDFAMPVGTMLEARRVTWLNPEHNSFREGDLFKTTVKSVDFFKFSLDETRFPQAPGGGGWAFDPMSNVAYRVVLVRPAAEPFLIGVLTSLLVVLLVGAAVASFIDLRRKSADTARTTAAPRLVAPAPAAVSMEKAG